MDDPRTLPAESLRPLQKPMLCKKCEGISLRGLHKGYEHAASFEVLRLSSSTCSLCALLWKAVITNAGCSPCLKDITTIHKEPIVLQGLSERFSSRLNGILINSHGEDEGFRFPGRAFGRVALFVGPGRLILFASQKLWS